MNWKAIALAGVCLAMLLAAIWLGPKPYYGLLVGLICGVNIGIVISRMLLFMLPSAEAEPSATSQHLAKENRRLRFLVEAAYEEGCAVGEAFAGAAGPGWDQSRAKDALRI